MTQEENMEKTVDDLRATEARIREAEAEALVRLSEARAALETSGKDDREAYAASLAAGETPPKEPRTPKLIAEIRDIEKRVLPGADDALWKLAQDAREAIRGEVQIDAFRSMRRWDPPHPVNDPSQPADGRHGAHRPPDVVAFVEHTHGLIVQAIAKAEAKRDREDRKAEAERRVNEAQTAHNVEQQRLLDEADAKLSVTARNAALVARSKGQRPWPDFDRRKWLEENDLLDDYGWVQGGGVIVKGGRERVIEQVPASEINSTQYTEA